MSSMSLILLFNKVEPSCVKYDFCLKTSVIYN